MFSLDVFFSFYFFSLAFLFNSHRCVRAVEHTLAQFKITNRNSQWQNTFRYLGHLDAEYNGKFCSCMMIIIVPFHRLYANEITRSFNSRFYYIPFYFIFLFSLYASHTWIKALTKLSDVLQFATDDSFPPMANVRTHIKRSDNLDGARVCVCKYKRK